MSQKKWCARQESNPWPPNIAVSPRRLRHQYAAQSDQIWNSLRRVSGRPVKWGQVRAGGGEDVASECSCLTARQRSARTSNELFFRFYALFGEKIDLIFKGFSIQSRMTET